MAAEPLHRLVQTLRTTLDSDTLTDAELLARFRKDRDPAAVEAIVRRHGPRVLAACRKVLGPDPEAEDAFQATFLVLLRNPAAVRRKAALGAWLYGVAHRISLQARARRLRRSGRAVPETPTPAPDLPWREACAILHEELDRLPDATRLPLMLCYLDGLSRDEAAQQLGRTLNSVKKALEKGREVLRKRLVRRGVVLSTGLLAAVAEPVADASEVSRVIVDGVIRPSAAVAALARAVGSNSSRVGAAAMCLAASVIAVGVALGVPGEPKAEPPPAKEMPAKAAVRKDESRAEGAKGDRITFAGRVVDPEGKPVAGAKMYLLVPDTVNPELRPSWAQRATTDQGGRFQFDEPAPPRPDIWPQIRPQLVAVADGFGLGMLAGDVKGLAEAELRLAADVPIRGRVLNLEGKPVAAARVRVAEVLAPDGDDLSPWFKKSEAKGWDDLARITGSGFRTQLTGHRSPLPGLPGTATGADGRFSLSGVGRERVAMVAVEGEGIATVRLLVLTQEGKSGAFPPARKGSGLPPTPYYRPPFDYVATPDQPFEGRVTDRDSGEPIAGLTVRQWWSETKTDRDGRYRLTGLRPGPTSLEFEPGSDTPYHLWSVPAGAKDSTRTARVDVALLRAPWVAGTVIDERTRKPVAGAAVWYKADRTNARAADYFDNGRGVDVHARTGPDGSFRLAGVPGRGWLFVHRNTRGLSAAERPVQGDTDQKEPPLEVETSDQAGLSPRMYQALVAVDINPKAPKRYTITLDPGVAVPVTLADPDDKPVTGVITLGVVGPWFQWSKPFASEKIEVPGFNPPRPRALFFFQPARNLGTLLRPKAGDAGPWVVKLQPTATVTGRLVLPDGKPYPNVSLELSFRYPDQRGPAWLPRDLPEARTKTDANGQFTFTKIIGDVEYDFWYPVFQDKHGTTTTIRFTARPGEVKDLGAVKTDPPRE